MTTFRSVVAAAATLGICVALCGTSRGEEDAAAPPAAKTDPGDIGRASTITLDVKDAELATVLAEFAKQSGNRAISVDADILAKPVTVKLDKTPYWEALDKLCAQQGLAYQADPGAGVLTLVPAPAGDVKTSYAGPVVFKLSSISAAGEADGAAAAGKLKCTVDFFWEDRLAPTSFKPARLEKLTDAAGNPCNLPRGLNVSVGKMSASSGDPSSRLEVIGGAFSGKFSFLTPRPAANGDAFAEISGAFGLVTSAGKIELRIENPLAEGGQFVERDGYRLAITKVEIREGTATLTTEFTRDGNPVALPWPARGGWSLVDAEGKATEGQLMGGCMVIVPLPAEIKGGLTLVRVYSPDAAEVTYLFKFTQAPIPK